jgi:hypothetical protein
MFQHRELCVEIQLLVEVQDQLVKIAFHGTPQMASIGLKPSTYTHRCSDLDGSASSDQLKYNGNNRENEQDVDEPAQRIRRGKSQ